MIIPRRILYALIASLALLAFSSAWRAPFVFDDVPSVQNNATIRALIPIGDIFDPPPNTAMSGRPIVNASFAINRAISDAMGIDPEGANATWGFHVGNILIHIVVALLLFGVLWRTWDTVNRSAATSERSRDGMWFASIVTLLWLIHPIQTEAVDYITQRTELLVSAFYLGTLYAAIRAREVSHRNVWSAIAVIACLLGMASKEVMISAPIMVVLYDRAFYAPSWGALWRDRSRVVLYVALAACMSVVIATVLGRARNTTVGFNLGITWYEYLYTQAWAITHYLRLIVWPNALNFDYGELPVRGLKGVPGFVLLALCGIGTLYAWTKQKWLWLGFLGAWFFLLLAPSSSIVPIKTEVAAERRVYLASAAIFVLAVCGLRWIRFRFRYSVRVEAIAVATVVLALTVTTYARGVTYRSIETLYRDVMKKAPENPRGYAGVGLLLMSQGPTRFDEAQSLLTRAVALDSNYVGGWQALGLISLLSQQWPIATRAYQHALRLQPSNPDAIRGMANALIGSGDLTGAMSLVDRIPDPDRALLWAMGDALVDANRGREALAYFERGARNGLSPTEMALMSVALAQAQRPDDAFKAARAATSVAGDSARIFELAGRAMIIAKQKAAAEQYLRRLLVLEPNDSLARRALDSITNEPRS